MRGTETLHLLWRQLLLLLLVVVPSQQVTVQKYVRTTLPAGLKLDPQFKVGKKEKCCRCSAAAGKDTLDKTHSNSGWRGNSSHFLLLPLLHHCNPALLITLLGGHRVPRLHADRCRSLRDVREKGNRFRGHLAGHVL